MGSKLIALKFRLMINKDNKTMKLFLSMFLLALLAHVAGAQESTVDIKDPKAKVILDKISSDLADNQSVEMDFELVIDFPGMGEEVQKGKLIQKGNKYYVDTEMQAVYSDGESLWMHMKNNNEVQLSNAEAAAAGGFMDPTSLLNLYNTGEYAYAITDEQDGLTYIEFKPLDNASPYSKMRLEVMKKNNEVKSMKVFSKDGSKFTMKINSIATNKEYPNDTFVFNASKFPGIHIEDLRID